MNPTHETNRSEINASEPDPPEILEANWDFAQVNALFDDLSRGAEVQHVQVRTASSQRDADGATTLGEAQRLLQIGEAKAIQIRYRFEQQSWCDTLMVSDGSVRIIRTRDSQ